MDPNSDSSSLEDKMTQLSQKHSECTICRVHTHLRNINKHAYEPQVIAIGPYHRDKDRVKMMEDHKLRYLKQLIEEKPSNDVKTYEAAVGKLEAKARKCYADQASSLSKSKFIEMLVLDGCFIIQLLRKCEKKWSKEKKESKSQDFVCGAGSASENDPIFEMGWMLVSLRRDLMLFENQVPFFVLCKLYDLIEAPNQHDRLRDLLLAFFSGLYPWKGHTEEANVDIAPLEVKHLLDLIHRSWFPPRDENEETNSLDLIHRCWFPPREETNSLDLIHRCWFPPRDESEETNSRLIPSAARLREANVKFKKSKVKGSKKYTLYDVEFKDGVMLMPPLTIEDNTESILRNLIVYEQYFQHNLVTNYVEFLDNLVNSSKDVEILSHDKVVENCLGDEEAVATMVNNLADSVTVPNDFIYEEVYNKVNKHCKKRMNKWKAKLNRNYFSSPWAIISVVAAIVLLLLTVTQTVFSILQVVL